MLEFQSRGYIRHVPKSGLKVRKVALIAELALTVMPGAMLLLNLESFSGKVRVIHAIYKGPYLYQLLSDPKL